MTALDARVRGSLTVVGSGIQFADHMTAGARARIERADRVLFLASDVATATWVQELNPSTESLNDFYEPGKDRLLIYEQIVERIMSLLRQGLNLCVVAYGHPGFFVYATHRAIRVAEKEGYDAEMLPAVSAVDCLFADLGLDPGARGCQIFDATDFLIYKRRVDTTCPLVLLQPAVTGDLSHQTTYGLDGLRELIALLAKHYGADHEVVLYEAAQYPFADPKIHSLPLRAVPEAGVSLLSTLFVPAKKKLELDGAVMKRLGITPELLSGGPSHKR